VTPVRQVYGEVLFDGDESCAPSSATGLTGRVESRGLLRQSPRDVRSNAARAGCCGKARSEGGRPGNPFQSRFGFAEWLQPYTQPTLEELARAGWARSTFVCPGFVSDCSRPGRDRHHCEGGRFWRRGTRAALIPLPQRNRRMDRRGLRDFKKKTFFRMKRPTAQQTFDRSRTALPPCLVLLDRFLAALATLDFAARSQRRCSRPGISSASKGPLSFHRHRYAGELIQPGAALPFRARYDGRFTT